MLAIQSSPTWQPHGLLPIRFLHPWNSPGKNTGVGSCSLLLGIFLTQGSNPCLLCLLLCRQILHHLSPQGSPNGIILSRKKECIWISSGEVSEHRPCYTKWNKSEREKQILYINAYIWNLGKWCWWTYLQGRNRDSERIDWWTQPGKERVGWTEGVALKYIH